MIQEVRGHFNINSIKNKLQKYYKCKICSNSKLKKKKKKKKKKKNCLDLSFHKYLPNNKNRENINLSSYSIDSYNNFFHISK